MSKTTPTVTAPAHMRFVSTTTAKAVTRPNEPTTVPARAPVEWYVPPHRRQVAGNAGVPYRKRFVGLRNEGSVSSFLAGRQADQASR